MLRNPLILWISLGVVAGVAVLVGAFLLLGGGGDDEPPVPDQLAAVQEILDSLPSLEGQTDADQMRSLLGPPDAFTIALEEGDSGVVRREEWFYYELLAMYAFVDGRLTLNLPLSDPAAWQVYPRQWDPSMFEMGETWDEVSSKLDDPGRFASFAFEPEYEIEATYYVGNQLLLLFDDAGRLIYVEAVPLEPAEADE